MKITFIQAMAKQNGGCRVNSIYAKKLLAAGHDVTVISRLPEVHSLPRRMINRLRGVPKPDPDGDMFFRDLGARHVQIPHKYPLEASDVPDADVVIATWWRTAFEVATLPPEKGKKFYFIQHHEVHKFLPWDLSGGSYYLPLKKITIADWLVETMANVYGDTDVIKVENSVDTQQFYAPPRARNETPVVGFLYSQNPFKGVEFTLKAVEIARRRFPDLKVVAFGASSPDEKMPLPENSEFHLLPAQDKLRDIYAQCDVWLCGSRAEGFHLPPSEAMACRCPLVSTRVGGAVEIVNEGVNGHIVDVEDAEALGARLTSILERTPEEWRAMSDAAFARVNSYTWDNATEAFEAALKKGMDEKT